MINQTVNFEAPKMLINTVPNILNNHNSQINILFKTSLQIPQAQLTNAMSRCYENTNFFFAIKQSRVTFWM